MPIARAWMPRRTPLLIAAGLVLLGALPGTATAQESIVREGNSVSVFHNLDFVAATGHARDEDVRVEVFRGPHRIASVTAPAGAGGLEINHGVEPPGTAGPGDCWDAFTPDIRPGDRIVVTGGGPGQDVVFVDDIRIERIFLGEPGDENVYVEGIARYANGTPIPIEALDSGEVRSAAPRLRATPTVSRVGPESDARWLATYAAPGYGVFLGTPDKMVVQSGNHAMGYGHVAPPPGAPAVRVVQLVDGPDATEPAPGCEGAPMAPANAITATDDRTVNAGSGALEVSGVAGDGVTAVGVSITDGSAVVTALPANVSLTTHPGGRAWTATFPRDGIDPALGDGQLNVTAQFTGPASATSSRTITKDVVRPEAPGATLAPGAHFGRQLVGFTTTGAGDIVRYTRDGSDPTEASQRSNGSIRLELGEHLIRARSYDAAGNPSPVSDFAYSLTEQPQPPTPAPPAEPAPPAPAPPVPPGPPPPVTHVDPGAPARGLALSSLTVNPRVRRSRARREGLRVVMRVPDATEVVRLRVFRRTSRGRRLVATAFRAPARGGLFRVQLRDRRLRGALSTGRYELEAAPGTSRAELGRTHRYAFRVLRG